MPGGAGGQPTKYNQDLADNICDLLSEGLSLRTACEKEGMPSKATIFNWLRTYPEFLDQYTRAKQEAADAMAEDLLDIADDGSNDWMEKNFGQTTAWVENGEALQRSKLRVDTRKFLMAKMKPKKYGDKIDVSATIEHVQPLLGGNTKVVIEGELADKTLLDTTDDIKS